MVERAKRRLAAIVAADVAGYSRLVGADEEGTLQALRNHRRELVDGLIQVHGGRIANTAGDSLLMEFASAVDAVRCATAIQEGMAERNRHIDPETRIRFRIGINVGDVVSQGDDILGDGVNIASRIESLAEPGGIAISDDAYRQVRDRLKLAWNDGGEREVKNIARPVRIWHWWAGVEPVLADLSSLSAPIDKPSIAVLPFQNLSGDPEQEYFADGIAEDTITALSRLRQFFVIARNTTFSYKGRSVDVREVAKQLGVRYVLEGSVRRAGSRVRLSAQLINGETGAHIWADRYDRDLEDIFAVQDELSEALAIAIEPEIDQVERDRARRRPPASLDAWSLYQKGLAAYYAPVQTSWDEVVDLFDQTVAADPNFAPAYAMAADARCCQVLFGTPGRRDEILEVAERLARQALALDTKDPICHFARGRVHSFLGEHDLAIEDIEQAIALNPNSALAHYGLGYVYVVSGRSEDAIRQYEQLRRLNPHDALSPAYMTLRGAALFDLERYHESVEWERRAIQNVEPRFMSYAFLAGSLKELGFEEEAKQALSELLSRKPDFSLQYVRQMGAHYKPQMLQHRIQVFERLGVPESSETAI